MGNSSAKVPTEFTELLEFLGSRPQPAVVFYAPDGARIELSGRVLGNWAAKLIGLFADEPGLAPGEQVVLDTAVHWKAAAVLLAAGTMGTGVSLGAENDDAVLVITDRPGEWTSSQTLGDAELAALSHGMLDVSFEEATGEQLEAWVLDISAEVRQQPDQLMFPLPSTPLPETAGTGDPLLVTQWTAETYPQMLGTWAAGGVVVLCDGEPSGELRKQIRRNEGI
ncbi:TIGR03089 family protein [Nesterenkonia ebinurensis]|uniref:TIGR03089 family protein n=1 Tax=Nesterenkonia ebinurensis TaxID=2608252 RepID=UPI00168AE982|nr:TIGR03089 family protein [Nesterenkonia ebinurensis]